MNSSERNVISQVIRVELPQVDHGIEFKNEDGDKFYLITLRPSKRMELDESIDVILNKLDRVGIAAEVLVDGQ